MAGTINEFLSSFTTDVARQARFDVQIPVPLSLVQYVTSAKNLSFRCETSNLPGRSMETTFKKMGSAPQEKFPYHTMYNEVNMNFIVSDDMNEKIFFDAWMDLINPSTTYNFQYKANYAVDISINQYDLTNKLTYSCLLQEAFPLQIGELDLDWTAEGFHKLAVVFTYKQWSNNMVTSIRNNLLSTAITSLTSSL